MLGLALEGRVLVACGGVDEGLGRLDEATAVALSAEVAIPISSAWTCCFMVSACTDVLDLERAGEWCDRIAAFAQRYGSRYMLAFCRAEYGAVHLWRGRWAEAQALLEAAVADFARSRPAWTSSPLVTLAELRRRQGRAAEAARLLERAGPSTRAQLCHARMALDRHDALHAEDLAERVLRHLPADQRLARAPALDVLVHARVALGAPNEAARALEALRAATDPVHAGPLRAGTDAAAGLVAAAHGDHEGARVLLEDAVDRFERSGAPYEAAHARLHLAASLAALGRSADADAEESTARERLYELGVGAGRDPRPAAQVTPREREVLALLAEGCTNRQIAERLVVSEHTVHRHVTNILTKLGLPSRSAAAAEAVRAGLVARR
jgi:DNA-binding NarL/FixJ family response regulator